jgi:isopenicillin-N epimerase
MVAVQLPDCDPVALHAELLKTFGIEVPCHRWKDTDLVRFSVQGYTTQADLDRLVQALSQIFAWG